MNQGNPKGSYLAVISIQVFYPFVLEPLVSRCTNHNIEQEVPVQGPPPPEPQLEPEHSCTSRTDHQWQSTTRAWMNHYLLSKGGDLRILLSHLILQLLETFQHYHHHCQGHSHPVASSA